VMGFRTFERRQRFGHCCWIDKKASHMGLLITVHQILQMVFEIDMLTVQRFGASTLRASTPQAGFRVPGSSLIWPKNSRIDKKAGL
jgi:hypothetical protein